MLDKSVEYLFNNCTLCAKHFEDEAFMNVKQKKKLVWSAIPTIFDMSNPSTKRLSRKVLLTNDGEHLFYLNLHVVVS